MVQNTNSRDYVKTTIVNGIATITFSHPKSNSLPGSVLQELTEQITETGNNPEAKVIILKSEGEKAFWFEKGFSIFL